MENDIIARNLVKLRKNKNLTQKELADELNYSDKVISKWERSESLPDILALEKIASYYNVSIDDLIKSDSDLNLDFTNQKQVLHLEPKKIKGPSKILIWSIVPLIIIYLSTIFIGIEVFAIASFVYVIIIIIYGLLVSRYTWEIEYQGVKINIKNKPLKTELRINDEVRDLSNKVFTSGLKLQAKLNDRILKVYIESFFIMRCKIIIE